MKSVYKQFHRQLSMINDECSSRFLHTIINNSWRYHLYSLVYICQWHLKKKFFMTFAYNCQWLTKTLFAQFLMYLSMIDDKHSLILLQMIVNHDWWNDLCNVFGHDCQWFMMSICKQFHMHLSMIDEECVYTVSSALVNGNWNDYFMVFADSCQQLMKISFA